LRLTSYGRCLNAPFCVWWAPTYPSDADLARYLEPEEQRAGLVLSDALQTQLKSIIVYSEEAMIGLKAGTANYMSCPGATAGRVEHIYKLTRCRDGVILAEGLSVLACVDAQGRICRVPEFMYPESGETIV